MNRAWIPAGALASLSVAGLLALGPLTDSMGTKVTFLPSVEAPPSGDQRTTAVPVNFDIVQPAGDTNTEGAALTRGGESSTVTPNSDVGQVGYRVRSGPATSKVKTKALAKPQVKKKVTKPKRAKSITGIGETNSTSGLTSGATGSGTDIGEQAPTPSSDAP